MNHLLKVVPLLTLSLMAFVPAPSINGGDSVPPGNDRALTLDFTSKTDGQCTLHDYFVAGATGGEYSGPNEPDNKKWTWEKAIVSADQKNVRVFDENGVLVMTFVNAAGNHVSAGISDGTSQGTYSGTWTR